MSKYRKSSRVFTGVLSTLCALTSSVENLFHNPTPLFNSLTEISNCLVKSAPNGVPASCIAAYDKFLTSRSKIIPLADTAWPSLDWKPLIANFTAGPFGSCIAYVTMLHSPSYSNFCCCVSYLSLSSVSDLRWRTVMTCLYFMPVGFLLFLYIPVMHKLTYQFNFRRTEHQY